MKILYFSQNIVINNFSEEVDKDGVCDQTNMVSFIGQIFLSEEKVFVFLQRYEYHHEFSIRKGRFVKKKDEIIGRHDFFYHRGCKISSKDIDPSKEHRKRESIKYECKTHLRTKLQKSQDIFSSEWRVTMFVVEHDHDLLTQLNVRFFYHVIKIS